MRIIGGAKATFDIVAQCGESRKVGLLRQIADGGAGLHPHLATVGFKKPCGDFQKRRFAGPVAADQRHLLVIGKHEFAAFEHRLAAEGQTNVFEVQ